MSDRNTTSKQNVWDEAQAAFERWHAGTPFDDSEKSKSWRAGYVSALKDRGAGETPAPHTEGERYRLNGYCAACKREWIVTCQSGTEVTVKSFHCTCGHVTEMDGRSQP